jgi:mRNA interferase MazF
VKLESEILRVHLKKGMARLKEDCDVMIDQIRAIDNKRFIKRVGELSPEIGEQIKNNISAILDM